MDADTKKCSQAFLNSVSDNISPARIPLMLTFTPGIKNVNGTVLEMGTVGNYTLCYQALIEDKVCSF